MQGYTGGFGFGTEEEPRNLLCFKIFGKVKGFVGFRCSCTVEVVKAEQVLSN